MANIRVQVVRPFQGRRDRATDRQLLAVGEEVTLDDSDPHVSGALKEGGYYRVIGGTAAPKPPTQAQPPQRQQQAPPPAPPIVVATAAPAPDGAGNAPDTGAGG